MPGAVLIMPKGSQGFDLDLVCICAPKPESLNRPYD